MICKPSDPWFVCGTKIKNALNSTNDTDVAISLVNEWALRYRGLYDANSRAEWPPSDQDRIEDFIEEKWQDEVVSKLDPAHIAFGLALAKFAPKLSAILAFLEVGPLLTAFYLILAPSPTENDFTGAKQMNDEIASLLFAKSPVPAVRSIRDLYPALFQNGYHHVKGHPILP